MEKDRKSLKMFTHLKKKDIRQIVFISIDDNIKKNKERIRKYDEENLDEIMKLSEKSFMEWDNVQDKVYNDE